MSFSELSKVIESLCKDRGISKEIVIAAMESAFMVTARKKFGIQGEYEAKWNLDDEEIEIYQYKNVVEAVKDPVLEIDLSSAKKLDEEVVIGDQLGVKIENPKFSRVDVQTAKQILFQKVRDAEREILFSEFKHREKQIISGIARRYERGRIMVDLGKAEAVLPQREMIPGENFKPGDRIQAYLSEVVMTNRGPEILLSRTSPMFLVKLFEVEVPEIQDGTIQIKSAAREPGQRAKIAVVSNDKEIDPVGACVGMKGSRVQNVVNELQGEKIDIVRWSDNLDTFSRAALAPAEIESIRVDKDEQTIDVIVQDDQLALAIGRRGQNVRLAAMLTGFKINILSKSKLQEKFKRAAENLLQIMGVTETRAQMLIQHGVLSVSDLVGQTSEWLVDSLEISKEDADTILKNALDRIEAGTVVLEPKEEEEMISASAVPAYKGMVEKEKSEEEKSEEGKFSEAERRLREELAAFKLK